MNKSLTDWDRLENMPDQDIDLSDAPEITPEMFSKAVVRRSLKTRSKVQPDYSNLQTNRYVHQIKDSDMTIILDPDVAEVFKTSEDVNSVLRALIQTMPEVAK